MLNTNFLLVSGVCYKTLMFYLVRKMIKFRRYLDRFGNGAIFVQKTMRMESLEQPLIVKITENCDSQIRDLHLKRMAVGMVLRGEMRLYYNDHCTAVSSGKIFLLGEGVHYVDSRCENGLFEQIVFYISATALQLHRNAIVIVDEAAAAKLQGKEYYNWIFDNEPEWEAYRNI